MVKSRELTLSWGVPEDLKSEENLGYILQIKQNDICVEEVIIGCRDCNSKFNVSTRAFISFVLEIVKGTNGQYII